MEGTLLESRGEMSVLRNGGHRSSSRLSRTFHHQQSPTLEDTSEHEASPSDDSAKVDIRSHVSLRPRTESSPLGASFSSSLNQRTPVRSYYQRSFQGSFGTYCILEFPESKLMMVISTRYCSTFFASSPRRYC